MSEPEWLDCSVDGWEKKSELCIREGKLAHALKYADYANCRKMYNNGMSIVTIQERFENE